MSAKKLRQDLARYREILPELERRAERWQEIGPRIQELDSEIWRLRQEYYARCKAIREADEKQRGFFRQLFVPYEESPEAHAKLERLRSELQEAEDRCRREMDRLAPFLHGYRGSPIDVDIVKRHIEEKSHRIAAEEAREQKMRRRYGTDDRTIAAAAFEQRTREEADRIKPLLLSQLEVSQDCPYCGGPLGDEPHADHIYPVTRGGLSTQENMVLVCPSCNLKKQDKTLREFIAVTGLDRDAIESRLEKLGRRF